MGKKFICLSFMIFLFFPSLVFPITLVRVGYIDLDTIIETYTTKYLETEISRRETYLKKLEDKMHQQYYELTEEEKNTIKKNIKGQNDVLRILRYNSSLWRNSKDIRDGIILQIVQRDIMEAIQKTSEIEGFSLVLDNTGNFIYGSDDINLTDRVLFRLDEKLLDLQNREPSTLLTIENEGETGELLESTN